MVVFANPLSDPLNVLFRGELFLKEPVVISWSPVDFKSIEEIVVFPCICDPIGNVQRILVAILGGNSISIRPPIGVCCNQFVFVIVWKHGESDTIEAKLGESIQHACHRLPV